MTMFLEMFLHPCIAGQNITYTKKIVETKVLLNLKPYAEIMRTKKVHNRPIMFPLKQT